MNDHSKVSEIIKNYIENRDEHIDQMVKALAEEIRKNSSYIVPSGAASWNLPDFDSLITYTDKSGKKYIPVFTGEEEFKVKTDTYSRKVPVSMLIEYAAAEDGISGLLIDRFGPAYVIGKEVLRKVISENKSYRNRGFAAQMTIKALDYVGKHNGPLWYGDAVTRAVEALGILNNAMPDKEGYEEAAAAVIFPVLDNNGSLRDDVAGRFGQSVVDILDPIIRDPAISKTSFRNRLVHTYERLGRSSKLVLFCETLAEHRELMQVSDLTDAGTWEKINEKKDELIRYYSDLQDQFYDYQFNDTIAPLYWELVDRFKDLFCSFWYDEYNRCLYQQMEGGTPHVFPEIECRWSEWYGKIPETAVRVPRGYLERTEDKWTEEKMKRYQPENTSYKQYYLAIKRYLSETAGEDLLDTFLIKSLSSIYKRYSSDIKMVSEGSITEKIFIEQCCGEAAQDFEREYRLFREQYKDKTSDILSFIVYSMPGVILKGFIRDGERSLTSEVWEAWEIVKSIMFSIRRTLKSCSVSCHSKIL